MKIIPALLLVILIWIDSCQRKSEQFNYLTERVEFLEAKTHNDSITLKEYNTAFKIMNERKLQSYDSLLEILDSINCN
jgi:hypothetical protein